MSIPNVAAATTYFPSNQPEIYSGVHPLDEAIDNEGL